MWNCLWPSRESADKASWHVILAQSMVIFALAGAIAAGAVAVSEQEAQRLERLLTWGHHLAFIYRQELLADALDPGGGGSAGEISYPSRGRNTCRLPTSYASTNRSSRSGRKREFAAVRALRPFLSVLPNPFEKKPLRGTKSPKKDCLLYGPAGICHAVDCPSPRPPQAKRGTVPPRSLNIWEPLDQEPEEEAHSLVRCLALGVVLFVAALVSLTLANILSRRQIFHNKFFVLGWLIELGAAIFMVFVGVWS